VVYSTIEHSIIVDRGNREAIKRLGRRHIGLRSNPACSFHRMVDDGNMRKAQRRGCEMQVRDQMLLWLVVGGEGRR
jgi:hypothetical protein